MEADIIESKSNQITIIANKITSGLVAFENRKAELIALKEQCEGLEITSIEDKQSIAKVTTFRKRLKSERVEIEKEAKSMRDPLTQINRTISEKENELTSIIEPTEKILLSKEKWVLAEKERIRQEDEKAEQARIQKRIDRLAEYGYSIDIVFLKSVSDADFEKVVENAKAEHEKELAAKAEAERLAQEEAARLKAERIELAVLREKQAAAQRIIDAENEKLLKDQEEIRSQRMKHRMNQITALGMKYNFDDQAFSIHDVFVAQIEMTLPDEEWNALITKITPVIEERKKETEEKRLAEIEQGKKEAAEAARKQALQEASDNIAAKLEAARLADIAEQERLAMASDKEKFQQVITQLQAIAFPEMKSRKSKIVAENTRSSIARMVLDIESHIGKPALSKVS